MSFKKHTEKAFTLANITLKSQQNVHSQTKYFLDFTLPIQGTQQKTFVHFKALKISNKYYFYKKPYQQSGNIVLCPPLSYRGLQILLPASVYKETTQNLNNFGNHILSV